MKKTKLITTLAALLLAVTAWADGEKVVTIPTTDGEYVDWNNATIANAKIENDGANVGSTGSKTVITFTLSNTVEQAYDMAFRTAHANNGDATMDVTLTNSSNETVMTKSVSIPNTGSWYLADKNNPTKHNIFISKLPVGTYTLTFKVTNANGYAGNWGNLAFSKAAEYDAVTLSALTIDGDAQDVATINASPYTMAITGNVYTAMPTVKATLANGTAATVSGSLSGTTATYDITGSLNDKTQSFKLTIDGVKPYTKTANDETVELKYTSAGRASDQNSWSNGAYVLAGSIDGWENSSFKLNDTKHTLSLPADVKVKQMVFKDFNSNYDPSGDEKTGYLTSVSSEGATVTMPTKHDYKKDDATQYDLTVILADHKAGAPITFDLQGGGQPVAWIELTVEHVSATEDVDITSAGYATYCPSCNVTLPTGVEAYTVALDGEKLTTTQLASGAVLGQGQGYLLKASEGKYGFKSTTADATATENNALQAAKSAVTTDGSQYALKKLASGNVGFAKVQQGVSIPAGKAYLKLSAEAKAFYSLDGLTDVTAINAAIADNNASGDCYTLQGMKTTKPQRGLYIKGGKKLLKK